MTPERHAPRSHQILFHEGGAAVVGYRGEHCSSVKGVGAIGSAYPLDEAVLAEHVLGDRVGRFSDREPVATPSAQLQTGRDELLRHSAAGNDFGNPEQEQVERIAGPDDSASLEG
jgi:hypothetical protein